MVFSSPTFLFLFLPFVLAGCWMTVPRSRNAFLCAASLLFYAWGEPVYVLLMGVSILLNFGAGLAIERGHGTGTARTWLAGAVTLNLLLLGHFKYVNFLVDSLNDVLAFLGSATLPPTEVSLPIGISFFTFHAISYLVDVYRRHVQAERSLVNLGLYIAMFPQLIAGPIIRYKQIAAQIHERSISLAGFSAGVERFVVGLAKKMLLANPAGAIADAAFAAPDGSLSMAFAWLGAVCYAVQIYFDFSGYSDMAIGLGRMFGFDYPENFRYPYSARSVRDFWRRWHISLSTWFRDYLYVPLGGNQMGVARTHWNLFVVFSLCGLWHGASWNFLLWGWLHGGFLVAERAGLATVLERLPRVIQHIYTLLVVLLGWVLFRSATPAAALDYLSAMLGMGATGGLPAEYGGAFPTVLLFISAVAATSIAGDSLGRIAARSRDNETLCASLATARVLALALTLLVSASFVAADTYNPFIYFRF